MVLPERRLIVNADDFGRSSSINTAVIRAHREGILTSASLMVNEAACNEAVCLAKQNATLGVGLHLALVCGMSALTHEQIPGLVDAKKNFSDNAVVSGLRYFFSKKLKTQLRDEIEAQFEKFHETGLPLDHVNGHLNIHLHPAIFGILMENAERWGIRHLRLTSDPFALNFKIASGNFFYRASHAFIFKALSNQARRQLEQRNIRHTENVFGLLQNARVDEDYLRKLLPELPLGDSELYSHPSLDEFEHEFDALISSQAKGLVAKNNIQLIRYQDL